MTLTDFLSVRIGVSFTHRFEAVGIQIKMKTFLNTIYSVFIWLCIYTLKGVCFSTKNKYLENQ